VGHTRPATTGWVVATCLPTGDIMGSTGTPDSIRRRQKARSTVTARPASGRADGSSSFEPQPGLLRRIQTFPAKPGLLLNSPSTPILGRSETYREMASMIDHSYGRSKALLALVPVAVAAGASGLPPAAVVFGLNFAALVPVAPLITFAVLSLTKDAGVAGGLLRAVLGNATEMIVSHPSFSPFPWAAILVMCGSKQRGTPDWDHGHAVRAEPDRPVGRHRQHPVLRPLCKCLIRSLSLSPYGFRVKTVG